MLCRLNVQSRADYLGNIEVIDVGGEGSGRQSWSNKKTTVEECRLLDANRWMREGILSSDIWRKGRWAWYNPDTLEKTS